MAIIFYFCFLSTAGNVTPNIHQRTVHPGHIQKVRERPVGARTPRENGRLRRRVPGKRTGARHRRAVQRHAAFSARPAAVHQPVPEVEIRPGLSQPAHETVQNQNVSSSLVGCEFPKTYVSGRGVEGA